MRKFIALVLMLSVFFTSTLLATTHRVIESPTAVEYVVQPQHAIIDFVGTLLIGELGFHQFYNGHIFMGILYIFTGGLFGIGYIYSIIVTLINVVIYC